MRKDDLTYEALANRTPTPAGAPGGGPGQDALTQQSRYQIKSRAEKLVVSPHFK